MKTSQATSATSRALAEKPPFAVVAKGQGTSLPVERITTAAREEMIRLAAHALYEAHGCIDGHDLEDWLKAEAQVAEAGSMASQPSR